MTGVMVETAVLLAAIAVVLARIGSCDAIRYRIPIVDVVLLALLGVLWRGVDDWSGIAIGAGVGAGAQAALIPIARWIRRKRKPAHSGDVYLMGASGAVLGPFGLALSWIVNIPLELAWRWCLSRRRKRNTFKGYAPLGPAYCVAVAAIVLCEAMTGRNGW